MDTRGARELAARIAVGAAAGERVEVVSTGGTSVPVRVGDAGTLVCFEDGLARIRLDSGAEIDVDPRVVRLRPSA